MGPLKLGALLLCLPALGMRAETPQHLRDARELVQDLSHDAIINKYGSKPTFLKWGHPTREAHTVCATFVALLLEHSYGLTKGDIRRQLGANGAEASEWHDAIVAKSGFERINNIRDIEPGDILAIKYTDGSKDTGHVMLVDHKPEEIRASKPLVPDTDQDRLDIIDSCGSGHGETDSRYEPGSGYSGGIGKDTIRLYTSHTGKIVGYAWSEGPKSIFYEGPGRDLVVGRFTGVR